MSEPDPQTQNEDRRRPKATLPYAALWVTCVVCVIFACMAMLNQA